MLLAAALWWFQDRLIYLPRPYLPAQLAGLPANVTPLVVATAAGSQTGFYVSPRAPGGPPTRVWLMFSGNAAQALGWEAFAAGYPREREAFLLIDYPGYGACAGRPSPEAILASSEALVARLAEHLGTTVAGLEPRIAVLGHSLGCAAALQYAASHRVNGIVLVAPFTSMMAMARRTVGWPLCLVLTHRFDNRARLAEIAAAGLPPTTIIHDDADEVVPLAMGRALAAEFPAIELQVVPEADHNSVLDLAEARIHAAMGR
jgi:pimeloyl-ACP methyl ester carboxylesterase